MAEIAPGLRAQVARIKEIAADHNIIAIRIYAEGSGDEGDISFIFVRYADGMQDIREDVLSVMDEDLIRITKEDMSNFEAFQDACYEILDCLPIDFNNDGGRLQFDCNFVSRQIAYTIEQYQTISEVTAQENVLPATYGIRKKIRKEKPKQ
jgi:hypothetical protein